MKFQQLTRFLLVLVFVIGNLVFFSNLVLLSQSATGPINHLLLPPTARAGNDPTAAAESTRGTSGKPRPVNPSRRHGAGYLPPAETGRKTSETDRLRSGPPDGTGHENGRAVPPWRSKQEIVFLKHLKNLTNTTTQTRRDCNGAVQGSIIDPDDVTCSSQSSPSEWFLLPVMLGNQGPNNQLQAFRLVAAVAMERNYTLVLAPFFNHASVDGLDMRCFEDTLDPGAISRLVPSITMDGFREKCGGRVDAVMLGTRMTGSAHDEGQRRGLELYMDGQTQTFAEMTGIQIPSIVYHRQNSQIIIDLPNNTPTHTVTLKNYLDWYPAAFQSKSKCVAFVYPYGLLGRFPHRDYLPLLARYLIRPKEIRTMAVTFLNETGADKTGFICVHWRFNAEWKNLWCSSHGRRICDTLNTMSVGRVAERFARLLDRYPHGALYLASPLGQQEAIVAALRRAVNAFFSSGDITDAMWGKAKDRYSPTGPLKDPYRLSLLEQEICSRSHLFIASEFSSWSDNVIIDRRVRGLKSMYIMDVLTAGDEVARDIALNS